MAARMRARRGRLSESQWREIVGRREASGLSVREFCQREGLSLSSYQRWRARCRATPTPAFVELVSAEARAEPSSADWSVELELPGGLRLRLRA